MFHSCAASRPDYPDSGALAFARMPCDHDGKKVALVSILLLGESDIDLDAVVPVDAFDFQIR